MVFYQYFMTMKKLLLFGLATLGFIFTSCKKDRDYEPETPKTMEELSVPASFNWKTTKDITITLTGFTSGIAAVTNDKGIPYLKAYLTADQPYTVKFSLPAYETKLTLKFMGQSTQVNLTGNTLNHQFTNP